MFSLFKKKDPIDRSSYILTINKSRCPESHRCPAVHVCPVGALTQSGNHAPRVNLSKCVKCGKCTHHCAFRAIKLVPKK
ncbi:MAG: 4Fe-4S dicluster domain-containing protein [Spirochaetia bacterium]|nr:4Fe-4S dicluster domain-containing protein [Spirochaetia bacterium]